MTQMKEKIYKIRGHELQRGDKLWESGEMVKYVHDHDHKIEYHVKGSEEIRHFTWGQVVYVIRLEEVKE